MNKVRLVLVSSCSISSNTESVRYDSYCTSRENSLELIGLFMHYI